MEMGQHRSDHYRYARSSGRRRTIAVLIAAGLTFPLAACAADESSPQGASSPTSPVSPAGPGSPGITPPPAGTATPPPGPGNPPPEPPPPALPLPPGTGAKRVVLERSGGFAGGFETLHVHPNGQWTYTGGRGSKGGGKPTSGQLTAAQRSQLQALLAKPELIRESQIKRGPANCNDGYNFTLSTGDVTVQWQSCSPADEPATAAAIVRFLTGTTPL